MEIFTPKEQKLLDFLKKFFKKSGNSPTFLEIQKAMNWESGSQVHYYLNRLKIKKAVLLGSDNAKRSIRLIEKGSRPGLITLGLFGIVHAGIPSDTAYDAPDLIEVPDWVLPSPTGEFGCLRVSGHSMREKGIFDGDVVVIRKQGAAENNQIVVASIDGKFTLKQYVIRPEGIELRPYNDDFEPIFIPKEEVDSKEVKIVGVYCGLVRKNHL